MTKKIVHPLHDPSWMMVFSFLAILVANLIGIWAINALLPNLLVLGTHHVLPGWALIHSSVTLALVGTAAIPAFYEWERRRGKALTTADWMLGYLIVNFVALWITARFSENIGLGVKSWLVVFLVAGVLDFLQGTTMMGLQKVSEQVKK